MIALFSAVILSIAAFTWKNGISPMPSSHQSRKVVMQEIKQLTNRVEHTIIDVGSGWGTLAIQAARDFPCHSIIGLENSHIPLWTSHLFKISGRYSNLTLHCRNIYSYSYAQASIVVCYLYPGAMKRLSTIFEQQLHQEATIISICFALPGWKPERIIECKDLYRTKIYVYPMKSMIVNDSP